MTTLFSYRRANTIAHKAPPLLKLAILLFVSLSIFSTVLNISEWVILAIFGSIAIILLILSKTPFSRLLKLRFIVFMGLFVTFFRVVHFAPLSADFTQIAGGMLYTSRFFVASMFVLVFFETTSTTQITDSLQKIQDSLSNIMPFLKPFFQKHNPARIMGLSIGFMPRIFATWEKVRLATLARTHNKKKNLLSNFLYIIEVEFSALLSCMINIAETTRKAVINRSEDL